MKSSSTPHQEKFLSTLKTDILQAHKNLLLDTKTVFQQITILLSCRYFKLIFYGEVTLGLLKSSVIL